MNPGKELNFINRNIENSSEYLNWSDSYFGDLTKSDFFFFFVKKSPYVAIFPTEIRQFYCKGWKISVQLSRPF